MSTVAVTANASPRDWAMLGLLGLIWGASFLGVELALTGFGPITTAAGRIGLAAIILVGLALRAGGLPRWSAPNGPRIWAHILGMALFTNAIPFALLSWAQESVTSSFAGITMAIVPLMVLPLAHLMVPGERMSLRRVAGFAIGFAGVVVLIGLPQGQGAGLARLACVGASACYAIGSINTRLCPPVGLIAYSAAGLTVAAILIVPAALLIEGVPALPPVKAVAGLLYLGLLPTALATVILVSVTRSAGPSFLSLVNYQVPVWAVILGTVFLGESLPSAFLFALILIIAGLVVSRSPAQRLRP